MSLFRSSKRSRSRPSNSRSLCNAITASHDWSNGNKVIFPAGYTRSCSPCITCRESGSPKPECDDESARSSSCDPSKMNHQQIQLLTAGYTRIHSQTSIPLDIIQICTKYIDATTRIVIRGEELNRFREMGMNECFNQYKVKYDRNIKFSLKLSPKCKSKRQSDDHSGTIILRVCCRTKTRKISNVSYKLQIGLVETGLKWTTAGILGQKVYWHKHAICLEDIKHCDKLTFIFLVDIDWMQYQLNHRERKHSKNTNHPLDYRLKRTLSITPHPLKLKKQWVFEGDIAPFLVKHLKGGQPYIIKQPDLSNWTFQFFPGGIDRIERGPHSNHLLNGCFLRARLLRRPYYIESITYKWIMRVWTGEAAMMQNTCVIKNKPTTEFCGDVIVTFPDKKAISSPRATIPIFDWNRQEIIKIIITATIVDVEMRQTLGFRLSGVKKCDQFIYDSLV